MVQSLNEQRSARPFVGREREVEEIAGALNQAVGGSGRLVLLAGEPGIGKTRLADEASARAIRLGAPVLWGRCWEAGGAPAYWPWIDVVAGLARTVDDAGLRDALGDGAMLVGELVPELRARLGELPHGAPPTPAEAQFRLWRSVSALIRKAAEPAGLVVVLDDLHAADEASLTLLHFVARELRSTRALVLATYRDVEARLAPAAGEILSRVAREGVTLSLARLDREAAGRFIRERAGPVEPDVEARIFSRAQGNPLFLEEDARLLGEQGASAVFAEALPHGVREVIRQRLDRAPAEARPLLDLAAVAGDEIDIARMAAASGQPADAIAAILAGAVRAGVLAEGGARRLRFSHALVREVLYRQLAPETRRTLHGQVAAALERLHPGSSALPLTELAHHTLEGPAVGLSRAVEFSVLASARALDLAAYEEAVALLSRAADAVESAGNPEHERARILVALAEAHIRRGETGPGKALCIEAAELGRTLADPELLARAALVYGQVFMPAMVDTTLVGLLEEALGALSKDDSPLRVRLMARLGAALQPARNVNEPVEVAKEAIAAARRLGDPAVLLGALHAGMSAMMDIVHPQERLALNLEAEHLAVTLRDRERLLRTHARIVMDHMALGQFAAADGRIDAFEQLARELRAPWHLWRTPLLRAMRALVHGRFEEANRMHEEAVRLGRESGDAEGERCATSQREGLLRAWERHDEMVAFDPVARRLRAVMRFGSTWQNGASSLVHARREDVEKTRRYFTMVQAEDRPVGQNVYGVFFFAEAAALLGDREFSARMYDMAAPQADTDVTLGLSCLLWEGPVTRILALLAAGAGRVGQAIEHFQASLVRLEKQDAGPYLARTRYEFARCLLAEGPSRDAGRAQTLLGAARDGARSLGLSDLARLCDARLGPLGAGRIEPGPAVSGAPASGSPDAVPFTMVLEGEYWAISHEDQTFRLKDSADLRYLAELAAAPDREIHVLDLAAGRAGTAEEAPDAGDAGELLDAEARVTYRRRLEDLREALCEAESFGDRARAGSIQEEIEFLGAELGRAVGLGGRVRRAAGASERARSAVQRRIRNALSRIEESSPRLAAYLGRTVKTGTFCVFSPREL